MIAIVGAGGAGREIAQFAKDCGETELCFLVEDRYLTVDSINDLPVFRLGGASARARRFVIAVGDPSLRRRLAQQMEAQGLMPFTLVHPAAYVGATVTVGEGAIISPGAVVTADTTIGRHAYLNVRSSVSHDVRLGDFAVLSPGATVCGHVIVGAGTVIGAGATIINGSADEPLEVGAGSVVGAGACVTRSVPAGRCVVGVPAHEK